MGVYDTSLRTDGQTDGGVTMQALRVTMIIAACAALAACGKKERASSDESPLPGSVAFKAAQALAAGPDWLAGLATIAQLPAVDSAPIEILREGTGGWTCFANVPASPRKAPLCVDEQFLGWVKALRAHAQTPALSEMAIAYALQGLHVASATDPLKANPDSGKPWVDIPPAVLIGMPNTQAFRGLPTAPRATQPWVLWGGTPWAVMVVPAVVLAAPPLAGKK